MFKLGKKETKCCFGTRCQQLRFCFSFWRVGLGRINMFAFPCSAWFEGSPGKDGTLKKHSKFFLILSKCNAFTVSEVHHRFSKIINACAVKAFLLLFPWYAVLCLLS